MSQKIDPRDVLKCLNELGYTGVDALQLKQFIKDLKVLMKYDTKLEEFGASKITGIEPIGREHAYKVPKEDSFVSSRSINDESSLSHNKTNVFDYLYTKETIASEAKRSKNKENVISVQIRRPNVGTTHQARQHVHCIHSSHQTENVGLAHRSKRSKSESDMWGQNSSLLGHDMSNSNVDYTTTYSNISGDTLVDKGSSYSKHHKNKTVLRPKASFIRPRFGKSFKTDPVALYHQYQEEWKKQKIPGEDNRADLRWAIRERMLGDTMRSVHSGESFNRRRPNSCQA